MDNGYQQAWHRTKKGLLVESKSVTGVTGLDEVDEVADLLGTPEHGSEI